MMKYSHETKNGVAILRFEGDLIGEDNGGEVLTLADKNIAEGITLCAVNISNVRYINSSGIGILITLLTKFRNKGGDVYLINPSEQVKKLLIITKLNVIFNILDDEDDALQKFLKKV